ncbi:proteasomal ATPase-associated factor 1-like, partial [Pollicipes pollicipes]|uniref:proteasomal ATPase-associated factor 1-like n=1 Tax=Pollicipes pollicipes TaxID=41117 RepID=UPI00188542C6
PAAELRGLHDKAVTGIDATPNGLGLSCSADETLRIWETDGGTVRRQLEGHLGEVYTCRFFPSGVVALSGGVDMQLKIWSAESGRCAATLRGHTAAVQHTAIVDRGRNVLSVSRDGRCKLWDVGEQRCLADLCCLDSPVNCVALGDLPDGVERGVRTEPPDEREVGTEGRLVALGAEDGSVRLLHAHSRHLVGRCGPDCEPVYGLSAAGAALFTAARDGCVRRYRLPL